MKIIDTHFHWFPSQFLDRIADNVSAPRAERTAAGYRYWVEDRPEPSFTVGEGWYDLERQLADMDATGHEVSVIASGGTPMTNIPRMPSARANDVCRGFNDAMLEAQSRYKGRFWGTIALPFQDADESAAMMEEYSQLGLRAINVPTNLGARSIDMVDIEPIYTQAERLGLPLILHASDEIYGPLYGGDLNNTLQESLGKIFSSSIAALRLVLSGVMDRHPDLKLIHHHVGGVLPYMSGRLDKNAKMPGLALPSEYVRRMYTDTVAPHAHSLKLAIEFYGVDHVMYGTDYPCWSPKAALEVFESLGLSAEDKRRILVDNAVEMFRLEEEAMVQPVIRHAVAA